MAKIQLQYNLKAIVLITIIVIASFTRLYRIEKTFNFHNDEGRDVLIVKKMIDDKRPVLLGPETSIGNMYLGPLYYYAMTPALLVARMNPVGPAIMVAIASILTTILVFLWTTQKFGMVAGFTAGLIYSLSPIMTHFARSSWNPNVVPLFMMVLLYVTNMRSRVSWLWLGVVAGILFQLHYVALTAVVVGAAILVVEDSKIRSWRDIGKQICFAIGGFILMSAPFWLFEIRHSFVNTAAFFHYLLTRQQEVANIPSYLVRVATTVNLVTKGIIGSSSIAFGAFPKFLTISFGALLLSYPLLFKGKTKYTPYSIQIWAYLVGTILMVSILKESIHVHYVSHLFPIVAILIGSIVGAAKPTWRVVCLSLLLYIAFWSVPTIKYNLVEKNSIQIERATSIASYIVGEAAGRPYNVVNAQGSTITTIQYYLALSLNPPSNSLQPLIFEVCEGGPCRKDEETTTLLFLSGPTHPSISQYLGHPQYNEFSEPRKLVRNVRISYDTYVGTLELTNYEDAKIRLISR